MSALKLLVVDDHRLYRKAIVGLIHQFDMPITIAEAENGLQALTILGTESIDVVLLDIQMPEMGGIELLRKLRHDGNATAVIILTQFVDESLILFLVQLGMNGFLTKNCEPDELRLAIESVATEGQYYNEIVSQAVRKNISTHKQLHNLDITPREFQVMFLLKEGHSNKEVARHLGLTIRTVESYRKSLIKKTNCKNAVDLISLAYRTGIMPG